MDGESKAAMKQTVVEEPVDDDESEVYTYEPLKEKNEIRLLTLLKGSFEDELQVLIHHTSLPPDKAEGTSQTSSYEALSYVWGNPGDLPDILVSQAQQRLSVTRNLTVALQYLRYEDRDRTLWADAACINQNDLIERGQQVRQMSDIYKRASRVVLWTGPETDNSYRALEMCQALAAGGKDDSRKSKPASNNLRGDDWTEKVFHDSKMDRSTQPLYLDYGFLLSKKRQALDSFFRRDCFTRFWIVPEMRAGLTNGILMCGYQTMPIKTLLEAAVVIDRMNGEGSVVDDDGFARSVRSIRSALGKSVQFSLPLLSVINGLRHFGCSDQRDRVFAISGCTDGQVDEYGIEPDYTKTTDQISRLIAVACAVQTRSLDFFNFCSLPSPDTPWHPSWVPDLPGSKKDYLPLETPQSFLYTLFAAEAQNDGGDTLAITGIRCGVVQSIKTVSFPSFYTDYKEKLPVLAHVIPQDAFSKPYISGGNQLEAYCRALFRGWFLETLDAEESIGCTFEEIFNYLARFLEMDLHTFLELRYWNFGIALSFSLIRNGAVFGTSEGYIGFTHSNIVIGDELCYIPGQNMPCCIRKASRDQYQLVGTCYVHGLMDGEAILGPLPSNITTHIHAGDHGQAILWFKDSKRYCRDKKDPRILSLAGSKACDWDGYLEEYQRLTTAASLRERSVPIETFNLI